jgi:NADH-quinone oxidoreductase subunit A
LTGWDGFLMTALVGYLLLFVAVGIGFILVHLLLGKVIRPAKPDPEKLTIYECGEPTIGSAWIQFDLRFYVIALLFVIFDVEVAFFFPWAVVFGQANTIANVTPGQPSREAAAAVERLVPAYPESMADRQRVTTEIRDGTNPAGVEQVAASAHGFALFAFLDILVFFGVLLVGFAYLWRRGDLAWVRSTAAERAEPVAADTLPAPEAARELIGAGRGE